MRQGTNTQDALLTRADLAEMFNFKRVQSVTDLVKKGILPQPLPLLGHPRWQRKTIEAFLDQIDPAVLPDGTVKVPARRGRPRSEYDRP